MKTFMTIFLAVAGLVLVGFGATAWAQGSGYTCTYNCRAICGTLNCYPGSYTCQGVRKGYLVQDPTNYGACNPGNGYCQSGDQTCVNQYYKISDCSSGCCIVTTTVQGCACS